MIALTSDQKERLLIDIMAERSRRSFFYFFKSFWDTVDPEPLVLNWHIPYICRNLQAIAERVFRREPNPYDLVINVAPGSTKSSLVSVMFPAWVWTRMPDAKFICSSYAYDLSMALSVKTRDIVQSERYKLCFPKVKIRIDKNAKGYFGNSQGGERFATSTNGSVTGFHGHFLLVDDPLDPRGIRSAVELRECNRWFSEILSSRKVDKQVVPTITVMQRLGIGDLTDHILGRTSESTKVHHICLPCDASWKIKPAGLKKQYDAQSGLMDPKRLSPPSLEKARVELGPREYAGQYGQEPRAAEGTMFPRDMFQVVMAPPFKVVQKLRYWDKAGTEGGEGSESAGVLLGLMENKQIIVLDCINGRWEYEKRESILLNTARMDGIDVEVVLEQEPGSGGKESAQRTYKNLLGFKRRLDRPVGEKLLRAEPWSIEVKNSNVYILRAAWNLAYVSCHEDFPQGKLKDVVDASAGAYNHLAKLVKGRRKRAGGWSK